MKIAVVGTGIMGLNAALEVLRQDHGTLTIFTDPNAKPASRCAGGMLAPYSESDSLDRDLQSLTIQHSLPYWRNMAEHYGVYFRENGTLIISHTNDESYQKRFEMHLAQGVYEPLDQKALAIKEPLLSKKFHRALWVYDEAHLNTADMLAAMWKEISKNAEVKEAYSDNQSRNFDLVIDARGSYAPLKNIRRIKGERIVLKCPDLHLDHCVRLMHPRYPLYIVPQGSNLFVVGASMIEDNAEEDFTLRSAMELMSAFSSLGGQLLESTIVSMESGFRPTYADHRPKITRQNNIVTCNGLYRHGFLLAPIMAKAIFDTSPEFNCLKEDHLETHH